MKSNIILGTFLLAGLILLACTGREPHQTLADSASDHKLSRIQIEGEFNTKNLRLASLMMIDDGNRRQGNVDGTA